MIFRITGLQLNCQIETVVILIPRFTGIFLVPKLLRDPIRKNPAPEAFQRWVQFEMPSEHSFSDISGHESLGGFWTLDIPSMYFLDYRMIIIQVPLKPTKRQREKLLQMSSGL